MPIPLDPLASLVSQTAACGVGGLLTVALLERLVPVLPSYGLLVAIGIAAAEGAWSVPTALTASTAGGFVGCLAFYLLASAVGEGRSAGVVRWTGRLAGFSPSRLDSITRYFQRHQRALAFGSQLVPTVRLVAPAIAGLLRVEAKTFAAASACGIALWNGVFIGIGYGAAAVAATTNISLLAFWVFVVLLTGESMALAVWYSISRRRSGTAD
jgi:membrane protein DedA with SNARE-associated domain